MPLRSNTLSENEKGVKC